MTILEVLENAEINFTNSPTNAVSFMFGMCQLRNALKLLQKGYEVNEDFQKIVGEGEVDDVPEKERADG